MLLSKILITIGIIAVIYFIVTFIVDRFGF